MHAFINFLYLCVPHRAGVQLQQSKDEKQDTDMSPIHHMATETKKRNYDSHSHLKAI